MFLLSLNIALCEYNIFITYKFNGINQNTSRVPWLFCNMRERYNYFFYFRTSNYERRR